MNLLQQLAVCFLSIVLVLPASPAAAQESVAYYEDAVSRFAEQDYKAAEIQLKNALRTNPQHLPSRMLLGRVHLRLGDPSSAEKELKIALRMGAARDKVYAHLGTALLLQRKYQEVLETITTVNASTSEAEEVYVFRGRAYLGLNRLDEAEASFDRAAGIAPEGLETLLGRSAVLKARNQLEAADTVLDRVVELYPDSLDAWFEKGLLQAARGNTEAALSSYNHVLEQYPLSYRTLVARGTLYLNLGDPEAAEVDLQLVHEHAPFDFNTTFLLAATLSQLGRNDESKALLVELSEFITRIPEEVVRKEPRLLRTATLLNYQNGDIGQAETYGSLYLSKRPHDIEMGKLLGAIYLASNQLDAAIETFYGLYRQRPEDPEILFFLGEAHLRKKQYAEASRILEQAARLAPDSAAVGTRLSLSKFGMGEPGEAESLLLRSFEHKSSEGVGAGFILAQLQLRKKDTEMALRTIRELISREPGNPVLYNLLGAAYLQAQDSAAARKAFERASLVSPGFLGSEYNLARLDITEGRYEDARARLQKLVEAQPASVLVLIALADLELAMGDDAKAIPWLVKATALDSASVEPGIKLVDLFIQSGEDKDALRQAENLVRLYPREAEAFSALARAQVANGQDSAASASLRRAALYAGSEDGFKLLGLADQQAQLQDFPGARLTLKSAINSDRSSEAWAAMIRLELATGNIEGAETALASLEKVSDNPAVVALFRGDIRLQRKEYKEAMAAYRQSFDLHPGTRSALGIFTTRFLLGHPDAAQQWLANWCLAHPEDAISRRHLARSRLSTGKRALARADYESLVKDGYARAEDYSFLARIYQLDNDERALATAKLALDLAPESPRVQDVYGWILVTEGRAAEGLPYLREAVSRDSDLYLRYHLASALVEVGRTDEARNELQAVLHSGQKLPWIASARQLLDSLPAAE
jgi:putative PEP-CTERM system TPR-repeat lipoprotein